MTTTSERTIRITEYDLDRLLRLIDEASPHGRDHKHLEVLERELDRGIVMPPKEIPADVITMNSRVQLRDVTTGESMEYTLVFPQHADIREGKISILAPIGTAMIGYRVGDTIEWKVPSGKRRLKVEKLLYQPEAAGDYLS
jgi:regulator of nucleoside diphosphate kinase